MCNRLRLLYLANSNLSIRVSGFLSLDNLVVITYPTVWRSLDLLLFASIILLIQLLSFVSLRSLLSPINLLPNMQDIVPRSYTFWYYTPSIPAAVIFMLSFIVLTGLHSWKLFTTKSWFCIAFTLGGLCMLARLKIDISSTPRWRKADLHFLFQSK